MRKIRPGLIAAATIAALTVGADSSAQPMGNRCFTPQFWCWLPSYAPIGVSCFCGTPYGPVWGRVG
ncbi:hypothetical protein SAMN05428950_104174 [Sphingomonas sp. OV641]|jgi:hypothetical protein|uniref:hypothetical protein n=1 Tax=Sphingomonas sp. OV641 TaxID=1881068 RepID=UPI0008D779D1|nr:hypothetical protein [Sphingomonas sp. OV641]SEJ88935.1 hypothetical protein SAMN05428950_104174 [Sphingomonas sp. OV641]